MVLQLSTMGLCRVTAVSDTDTFQATSRVQVPQLTCVLAWLLASLLYPVPVDPISLLQPTKQRFVLTAFRSLGVRCLRLPRHLRVVASMLCHKEYPSTNVFV